MTFHRAIVSPAARMLLPRSVKKWRLERSLKRLIEHEGEPELAEVTKLVSAGDLCLDVGCNIGVYAYLLARHGCRVVAFEPNPAVAAKARLISGVEILEVALSSADGHARLTVPLDEDGTATLRPEAQLNGPLHPIEVDVRRLDGFGFRDVAFIKIDVEGVEERVLDGGWETIRSSRPMMMIEIEERHNPGGLERVRARLGELGYEAHFLDRQAWRPIEAFDAAMDQPIGAIASLRAGATQRTVRYINNFLFLPPGRKPPGID